MFAHECRIDLFPFYLGKMYLQNVTCIARMLEDLFKNKQGIKVYALWPKNARRQQSIIPRDEEIMLGTNQSRIIDSSP